MGLCLEDVGFEDHLFALGAEVGRDPGSPGRLRHLQKVSFRAQGENFPDFAFGLVPFDPAEDGIVGSYLTVAHFTAAEGTCHVPFLLSFCCDTIISHGHMTVNRVYKIIFE